MKFSDGYWRMRPGVRALAARQLIELDPDRCEAVVASQPVRGRADTIDRGVLTVELRSPIADVIGVRIVHFAGGVDRGPAFEIADEHPEVDVRDTEDSFALTSGRLTARFAKGPNWRLSFEADERELTASERGAMAALEVEQPGAPGNPQAFVREQLTLDVGALVYGLGERFGPFVKNGQSIDIWNQDGGTASEQAYKNVPFYLTNRGYGVFVNDPGPVSFEVASERVEAVQFSVPGQVLEYFVIHGPTPKEILARYTALTGRPALPPAWSFGLWLSTSFTTDYDEASVTALIDEMAARDIPLSVFHFDCFWMRGLHWTDFRWDNRSFPDPDGMLARLKARGVRICVWMNPYIAQRSELFAEGRERGYLVRRPDGSVWQTDMWQPGMALVDFTNPDAREWFAGKVRALVASGVDALKTDFGERIPTDVTWHDGSDAEAMHNFYTLLYNRTVWDAIDTAKAELTTSTATATDRSAGELHAPELPSAGARTPETVLFARSATAGSQRYPVHWGGDSESTYRSMAETLRGGLSLALSGFGFWSHDIGGFEGTPPAGLYKRWAAFGLLSSHSRLHGSTSYRVPWIFDDEAVDVVRTFTRLKCRLMPYLFGAAAKAARSGVPVLRPMVLEFPDDPACEHLDRQYMLGPSLLVAPVFSDAGDVRYYVPEGRWTKVLTGEAVDGPGWRHECHGFLSLPLLARPGSIVAWGGRDDRPDYDYAAGPTVAIYGLVDGGDAQAIVPDLRGEPAASFSASRRDEILTVERRGGTGLWSVLLPRTGAARVRPVAGVRVEASAEGTRITIPAELDRVEVALETEK